MIPIENTAEEVFDKIRNRFSAVRLGDESGKDTGANPKNARFFNFDFVHDSKNFGNVTVSLLGDFIKVFYSNDMLEKLDPEDRKVWFDWIKGMRQTARENTKTFDVRDISKSGLSVNDLSFISNNSDISGKNDVKVVESKLFGSSRTSYQQLENVRIIARHRKPIMDENIPGARSRNIESFFIENSLGERFKLPEGTTLNGARAYARHVKNGGQIYDDFGQHIAKMINEMNSLRTFVRNMRGRQFEDTETGKMVEAAIDHYGKIHSDVFMLRSQRGYEEYKNLWQPEMLDEEDIDIDALKERFVKKIFDERLTAALPIVYKAHKIKISKEQQEFESWANDLIAETERNPIDLQNIKSAAVDLDLEETEDSSSPLTHIELDLDSDGNIMDTEDSGISQLLTRNGFQFKMSDGVYYFESKEEIERAKDIIAQHAVKNDEKPTYPEMGVFDYGYGVYGSTTFDRELPGHGVKEDIDLLGIQRLAGLIK